MSSASDLSAIAAWNNTSALMNRYLSILVFLFGTIGNLLNVLVLSQGTLRRNPCALYFLISSLANLAAILSGLTTRMLSGWALDLTNTIDWLCKLRAFVLFLSRNTASWLIMFAALDRWLLSSIKARRRRFSTFRHAQWSILLVIILSVVIYGPIFYCYEANLTNAPLRCYGKTDLCRYSNDFSYAFLTIIIPIIFMMIFGLMTILNIRHAKSRIHTMSVMEMNQTGGAMPSLEHPGVSTARLPTTATTTNLSKKKIDRRLFLMLLIQIILTAVFTLPQAVQKVYSTVTANEVPTGLKRAIDNFVFNLVLLLTYVANGMPFYIYTLSGGPLFRNTLKHLIQNFGRKLFLNATRLCTK